MINCPHYPGVSIKQANLRDNIYELFSCRDKENCPLKMGVCIKRVSVEWGFTLQSCLMLKNMTL